LAIAERIFASRGRGWDALRVAQGSAWSLFESQLTDELDSLVERGWVSRTVADHKRRLTAKGALLMAWKHCWPVRALLDRAQARASKKALEEA
jgi:DNA-binding MarR family transcriptional regulator